jgi:primosomal protein N' (replication factor Y)
VTAILGIAIDAPLRRSFDYRAPPSADLDRLRPGSRLWVPFGRRRVVGIFLEQRETSEVPDEKLRSAYELIDEVPVFDPHLFELLCWSADYYRHPVGEVLSAALPAPLRAGAPLTATEEAWTLTEAAREGTLPPLTRARKLQAVVDLLGNREFISVPELAASTPRIREHLRELQKRGWVSRRQITAAATEPRSLRAGTGPTPSEDQQRAIEAIDAAAGRFVSFLLHGVTGSGKTEVYLRAIESTIARGEQALVLVPEIALTPQLVGRFAERFDAPLAVMHSSLADQERLAAWRAAREGTAPIVIGTRSAIFAPLAKPGLIVVDEEHDSSYKQQEGFRYSARDLALARAQRHGIPVVLGSATPSLESLARVRDGRSRLLQLPSRVAGAKPPKLSVIDLRRNAETQGIATPAVLAVKSHLAAGGQVLLYLNRRGYAPSLFCPNCGWVAPCPRCDARLTVHRREQRLTCHHCGTDQPVPESCPSCHEPVKPVGQGTERIEETLARLFPEAPIERIDRDAVRRKGALEDALGRIARGEARVLVGTQMLTKGHHFPEVTLVVVLNADQGLFSTDFRASERLAQTIVQVAGRAGRAERPGEVLIQTEYPEHPLLVQLVTGGYDSFAAAALAEREQAGWPPFARVAVLRAEAVSSLNPIAFLDQARLEAERLEVVGVELLGPAPAPMERRAGHYRAQLLLHAKTHAPLQRLFARWLPRLEALPEARQVRWSLDVDPLELF